MSSNIASMNFEIRHKRFEYYLLFRAAYPGVLTLSAIIARKKHCIRSGSDSVERIRMRITIFIFFHFGRYNDGHTFGNLVPPLAEKLNFPPYIRRYTSPNENFEYIYPINVRPEPEQFWCAVCQSVSPSVLSVCEKQSVNTWIFI